MRPVTKHIERVKEIQRRLLNRNVYKSESMNMFLNKLQNKGYNIERTILKNSGNNCFITTVRIILKRV